MPDTLDACPDVVGIKTADPKTHGCPAGKTGTVVVGAPVALQPAVAKAIAPVVVTPAPAATPAPVAAPAAAVAAPAAAPPSVWYKPWTWF
jgi:2-oxoglutarate dehydrogenase E2 component (dihydrolipoamide succinyltransferase)